MKQAIVALLIMATPLTSFAAEKIYFNILSEGEIITFTNYGSPTVPPIVEEMAILTFAKPFSPELVRKEYYQLTINRGILWKGKKVIQYDYAPLIKDRFRNIFWITEDKKGLVKTEIFDTDDRLLFSAVTMNDSIALKPSSPSMAVSMNESLVNIFGFSNIYTEYRPGGSLRMTFTDGLNRFSIFRSAVDIYSHEEPERVVMYGNYVFNKRIDRYQYTVVGSIPYYRMEEVVLKLAKILDDKEMFTQIVEGKKTNNDPSPKDSIIMDSIEKINK